MSSADHRRAILTRERGFEDAWITYQNVVNRLSPARIAELAVVAAVRLADGSFDLNAGLGKHIAERTVRWRLAERREQYVEDMIARPITDMIAEELQALEEEAAWWATMSRPVVYRYDGVEMVPTDNPPTARMSARTSLLRVMESKRKLLGIDQPTRIEVATTPDTPQDDPLRIALEAAAQRRAEAYADIRAEEDIT